MTDGIYNRLDYIHLDSRSSGSRSESTRAELIVTFDARDFAFPSSSPGARARACVCVCMRA